MHNKQLINQQQFNEQFSRIWKLIHSDENELVSFILPLRERHSQGNWTDYTFCAKDFWTFSDVMQREFLVAEFTSKNEKGEWLLEEGNKENPNYTRIKDELWIEHKESITDNEISEQVSRTIEVFGGFILAGIPKILRDLFLSNCVPSYDPEQDKIKIKNLELIKW